MTLRWMISNSASGTPLNENRYSSEALARADIVRLGEVFSRMYVSLPEYDDPKWQAILFEGLRRGDLEGILLPQFSVDVYVPGDASTDNIVVGFLIKGVPEAVYPFKNFCAYSRGVKKVDYGDSDTMPHTSVVYVEFDREQFDIHDFHEMIDAVCRLSGFEPSDLSVSFPNSNKVFPYETERVQKYFARRNVDRNRLEQWKANNARQKQIQKEIEHEMEKGTIAQRLGGVGGAGAGAKAGNVHTFQHLKHPNQLTKPRGQQKAGAGGDIPDTIKASIRADAQRNRTNHQLTWEEFDKRWAARLHAPINKIASIRKQIYGGNK